MNYMRKFILASLTGLGLVAVPSVTAQVFPFEQPPTENETVRVVPESDTQVRLSYAPVVKDTAPAVVMYIRPHSTGTAK